MNNPRSDISDKILRAIQRNDMEELSASLNDLQTKGILPPDNLLEIAVKNDSKDAINLLLSESMRHMIVDAQELKDKARLREAISKKVIQALSQAITQEKHEAIKALIDHNEAMSTVFKKHHDSEHHSPLFLAAENSVEMLSELSEKVPTYATELNILDVYLENKDNYTYHKGGFADEVLSAASKANTSMLCFLASKNGLLNKKEEIKHILETLRENNHPNPDKFMRDLFHPVNKKIGKRLNLMMQVNKLLSKKEDSKNISFFSYSGRIQKLDEYADALLGLKEKLNKDMRELVQVRHKLWNEPLDDKPYLPLEYKIMQRKIEEIYEKVTNDIKQKKAISPDINYYTQLLQNEIQNLQKSVIKELDIRYGRFWVDEESPEGKELKSKHDDYVAPKDLLKMQQYRIDFYVDPARKGDSLYTDSTTKAYNFICELERVSSKFFPPEEMDLSPTDMPKPTA